ncbi:MAG: hypothetical protein J5744_07735 [Oscillospiraceae bacterium]|nr:hypothetical protein [Oscillospiraceae bacterium]
MYSGNDFNVNFDKSVKVGVDVDGTLFSSDDPSEYVISKLAVEVGKAIYMMVQDGQPHVIKLEKGVLERTVTCQYLFRDVIREKSLTTCGECEYCMKVVGAPGIRKGLIPAGFRYCVMHDRQTAEHKWCSEAKRREWKYAEAETYGSDIVGDGGEI